jgi:hypothetical protein
MMSLQTLGNSYFLSLEPETDATSNLYYYTTTFKDITPFQTSKGVKLLGCKLPRVHTSKGARDHDLHHTHTHSTARVC